MAEVADEKRPKCETCKRPILHERPKAVTHAGEIRLFCNMGCLKKFTEKHG